MIKYIVIALSLLLVGSIADVPVMFLAVHGTLSLAFVVITGFLADILPDFFWYWLGGRIGIKGFNKIPFLHQKTGRLEAVGDMLDRFGGFVLFGSKFVYWLGIPTQVMAGVHKYPLKKAFVANALGSLGWLALLFGLAHLFTSAEVVEMHLKNVQLDFSVFAAAALLLYFIIGGTLKYFLDKKKK